MTPKEDCESFAPKKKSDSSLSAGTGEFVDDDAGFEVSVAVWERGVAEVHSAPSVLAVGWGHEVRVVVSRTVLRVGDDRIVLRAAAAEVVLLEVAGDLVEAVAVI